MGAKSKAAAGGALALAIGFLLLKEGTRYDSYVDVAGVKTICVGHTGPEVKLGQHATKQMCDDLLRADLDPIWAAEGRLIPNVESLDPWTRAAMASFMFNAGIGAFEGSSMLRLLKAGKVTASCDALLWWTKARAGPQGALVVVRGLINRRQAERALCLGEGWELEK